jgi:hypothetical protein
MTPAGPGDLPGASAGASPPPVVLRLADRLEYATAQDPSRNYCLWDYSPAAPAEDKFRSINLLLQSFDHAGLDPRGHAIVDAIRGAIGSFRTVFGIKQVDGRLAWEFYFYDYARQQRQVSATQVLQAIAPWMRCDVAIDERLPYFMFSLDLDDALASGRRDLEVVHLYIGNPGSTVSSGIAYAARQGGCTLENFYFFFDANTQLDQAADKIACSAHLDTHRVSIDQVLRPELRHCHTICVANKSTHDCVYFSGVNVDQLMHFLQWLQYPQAIRDFVALNRQQLDHLLFDVGFDYRASGDRLQVLKSGYYGVF